MLLHQACHHCLFCGPGDLTDLEYDQQSLFLRQWDAHQNKHPSANDKFFNSPVIIYGLRQFVSHLPFLYIGGWLSYLGYSDPRSYLNVPNEHFPRWFSPTLTITYLPLFPRSLSHALTPSPTRQCWSDRKPLWIQRRNR